MTTNEYLAANDINIDFVYPGDYLNYGNKSEIIGESRWWFIGSSKGLFKISYELINNDLKSKKLLIPFAKSEEAKALACFDNKGNVYFYVGEKSFENVDWENRFYMTGFTQWLNKVMAGDL